MNNVLSSSFTANVDGRAYTFHKYMRVSKDVRERRVSRNDYTTNGCGNSWLSNKLVGILESYFKVKLIKCCIIHDLAYELADNTIEDKIRIDGEFHINIFLTCMDLGLKASKARSVSRLFHMAVLTAGTDSYSYKKD